MGKMYENRTLSFIELSDLQIFQEGLPEGRIKELLDLALYNLEKYQKCGTPWDCVDRLEWMRLSPEDIRSKFAELSKFAQEYIEEQVAEKVEKLTPKRGRPKKVKEG